MKKLLRPKILIPAVLGLVGLGILGVYGGVWWAEAKVETMLVDKAASRGWTLTVEDVDVTLDGEVTVTGISASGPEGGRLTIERMEAQVPPSEAWAGRRMPGEVDLYGVDVYVGREDIEALRDYQQESDPEAATGQGLPKVYFHDAEFSVPTGTDLGVVRLITPESQVERTTEAWVFEGSGDAELDASYALDFKVEAVPSNEWVHLVATFETPIAQEIPRYGRVSVRSVDIAGTPAQLTGSIKDITVEPVSRFGVGEVTVDEVDLSVRIENGKPIPESVRVVRPRARLELRRMLAGPVGQKFPVLVDAAETARRFLGAPGPPFETTLEPGSMESGSTESGSIPPGSMPGEEDPGTSDEATVGFDAKSAAEELLAALPGVIIEGGVVELELWEDKVVVLDGIGFDTAALQDSDGRRYAFAIGLRGAEAKIGVELPEEGMLESWPALDVELRGLEATDLFGLLGLQPPEQLTGALDFDLEIAQSEVGELLVNGGVALREIGFYHDKISSRPVKNIDASLQIDVRYDHDADMLWIDRVEARSGPATAFAKVEVKQVRTDPRVEFTIWAEELSCEALPAAIPEGMLGTIERLEMSPGTMSPRIEGSIRIARPHSFKMTVEEGFTGDCKIVSLPPHDVEALLEDDYTFTFTDYTTLANGVTVGPGSGTWVPLRKLPGYIPASMYLTEDKRFYDHDGLRPTLISRAVRLNLEKGRYVYGGSTISQQLVKNLFLSRHKTLARKLEEVLIVWKMEWTLPKDRILELYINCIEFGPDVYGITQGAAFYFDKDPEDLTPVEAGYLASLKVKPRNGGKFYLKGFPQGGRWWNKRQRYISVVLAENGYISPLETLSSYPWLPQFQYPDMSNTSDFRTRWLQKRRNP